MDSCIVLAWLTLIVLSLKSSSSSATVWNLPRPINGYESYLDVAPSKFVVPPGLSHMNFSFHAARNDKECSNKMINVLIQHGGLPLVIQSNYSFPDNFIVKDSPTLMFSIEVEHLVGFSILRPPPGAWFVIAFFDSKDNKIQQKGLVSDTCIYSYISRVELGEPVIQTPINYYEQQEAVIGQRGTMFSFKVPPSSQSFTVQIANCQPHPCDITLSYSPFELSASISLECNGSAEDCKIRVPSPSLDDLQLIQLKYNGPSVSQQVTFSISVEECKPLPAVFGTRCISLPQLDRIQSLQPFVNIFGFIQQNLIHFAVNVVMAPFVVIPFDVIDPNDIGGSLKWSLTLVNHTTPNENLVISVCGALLYNYLPDISDDFELCANISDSVQEDFTLTESREISLYVPYPRIGPWHVMLQTTCLDDESGEATNCPSHVFMDMSLQTAPCMDDGCSGRGKCMFSSTGSDLIHLTACRCDALYLGFACTDDTKAQSVAVQLAGAYLLTLSNLFFIPSIVIGIKRRYFVEAFVYFYTMFFSSFYHACDGQRLQKYRMCIIKYDVLQAADFFGSACSLWITLVAMARIRYPYITPLLQIVGPFGLLIGIVYDRTSLCVIAVPIFGGLLTIACSWGYKMYKRKALYPTWRRYVFFLLPGVVLAATGSTLFSFLETKDNYKYIHSVWHLLLALCICFLLPPRRKNGYETGSNGSNTSTHPLTPMNDHSTPSLTREASQGYDNEIS